MKYLVLLACLAGCTADLSGVASYEAGVRVCAKGETTRGIDVSHWDGSIDWEKVAADNVAFTFIKATQGTTFVDPEFATNWTGAHDAGVIRGAYHFFEPAIDAIAQADFFVKTAGVPALGDFPLTIDLEKTDGATDAEIAAGALAFLQRVEALTGRVPIIYTSARVFDTELGTPAGFSKYPLWNANYTTQCPNISQPTWETWTFWQDTDKAVIDGIDVGCDQNHFNGTMAELVAFVNPGPVEMPDAAQPVDGGAPDVATAVDLERADDLAAPTIGPHGVVIHGGCRVAADGRTADGIGVALLLFAALLARRVPFTRGSREEHFAR